jgi:dCMP deaminase
LLVKPSIRDLEVLQKVLKNISMASKWDQHFFNIAKEVASLSKDPSTKVSCVAVSYDRRILSTGYNGFPRGVEDSIERLSNRETKLKFMCHAEKNCIYNACHHGISLNKSTVYIWGCPLCHECAKGLIQVGVQKINCAFNYDKYKNTQWYEESEFTLNLLQEAGVEYHETFLANTNSS